MSTNDHLEHDITAGRAQSVVDATHSVLTIPVEGCYCMWCDKRRRGDKLKPRQLLDAIPLGPDMLLDTPRLLLDLPTFDFAFPEVSLGMPPGPFNPDEFGIIAIDSKDEPAFTLADVPPISASDILGKGKDALDRNAALRDTPQGERAMVKTVAMFNALTGGQMSELDGWRFMLCLKMARAQNGKFHEDDFVDLGAYAGLAGECAARGEK